MSRPLKYLQTSFPAKNKNSPILIGEFPTDKRSSPADKRSSPADKRSSPADKQSSPADKQSSPADKQSSPVDKQSSPVDERIILRLLLPSCHVPQPIPVRPRWVQHLLHQGQRQLPLPPLRRSPQLPSYRGR